MLDVGGDYAFRLRGEDHAWTPETVAELQHAVRGNVAGATGDFARLDQRAERAAADHPRPDRIKDAAEMGRSPCRSTRSSRPPTSSSASPPAR